ncbi:BQ5605_C005g03566 [Microbotryum silenes-dioicae]|uniref:BQ5605_C005g03566 protein n=1 Tax=Microbotryum silenes-dioicae TaxID=796604 RepID=A0A2X0N513_9BASI|nr:BQ5605_C005g03566 [Microbotryum silenes-dioicae]
MVDAGDNVDAYKSETKLEAAAKASKEANMAIAEDSTASITDRASAAISAVGDKIQESTHGAKTDAHQEVVEEQSKI